MLLPCQQHSLVESNFSIREALLAAFKLADQDPEDQAGARSRAASASQSSEPIPLALDEGPLCDAQADAQALPHSTSGTPSTSAQAAYYDGFGEDQPALPPLSRKEKAKRSKDIRRIKSRQRMKQTKADTPTQFTVKLRSSTSEKYRHPSTLNTTYNAHNLPASGQSWTGRRTADGPELGSIDQLISQGLRVVAWNGRTPTVITDNEGRIICVLAGRPADDPSWDATVQRTEQAMNIARDQLNFREGDCVPKWSRCVKNRRGSFKTASVGISYGGGQKQPQRLKQTEKNEKILDALLASPDVVRIAKWGQAAFGFFAPKLFQHYQITMEKLYSHDNSLKPIIPGVVFPAASFNFGPRVLTVEHVDYHNLPNGWCFVFSMGHFNPKEGGHLVLNELKLILEFPPGSAILLPSGAIRHGNVPIQASETRSSFTMYAAGGLFRWVEYGFQTHANLLASNPQAAQEIRLGADARWENSIDMFSRVDQLSSDHVTCGLVGG